MKTSNRSIGWAAIVAAVLLGLTVATGLSAAPPSGNPAAAPSAGKGAPKLRNVTLAIRHRVFHEFADFGDAAEATRAVFRLILAAVLGAALGYEREAAGKPAGVRTHMLVALGAALFVLAPVFTTDSDVAISRVIQGLVAGIGFLGAGAILKQTDREQVKGLTTAAGIWSTAAIATAAGLGKEGTAVFATILVVIILRVLLRIERRMIHDDPHGAPERSDDER